MILHCEQQLDNSEMRKNLSKTQNVSVINVMIYFEKTEKHK